MHLSVCERIGPNHMKYLDGLKKSNFPTNQEKKPTVNTERLTHRLISTNTKRPALKHVS